jgi:hypothetical protein
VTGALAVGWHAVGSPAVSAADAGSLRHFAEEVRTRFPEPRPPRVLRAADPKRRRLRRHPIPSLERDAERITPGLGVIAGTAAYERLAAAGRVGERIASGEGRVGNLDRSTLVLAEGREKVP